MHALMGGCWLKLEVGLLEAKHPCVALGLAFSDWYLKVQVGTNMREAVSY